MTEKNTTQTMNRTAAENAAQSPAESPARDTERPAAQGASILEIPVGKLRPHPKNLRKTYEGIDELAASIAEKGILQNLTVVPDPADKGTYLVVIGNRRLLAAVKAKLRTAPCRVIPDMPEAEQAVSMLTENIQRSNLKVAEEAAGVQMCLSDYGFSVEDLAKKTGLSQTTIRHRANIAKLDRTLLEKKEASAAFQLNIADLAALEKIASIKERNKILRDSESSRDLACRAQRAAEDEKRAKVLEELKALAEKEGIAAAPAGTENEIYGSRWETVKEYSLDGKVPKSLIPAKEREGLFFLPVWRSFKIIRRKKQAEKAQTAKTQHTETEYEKKKREAEKNKRAVKSTYREMHAQMTDFVRNIATGKIRDLKAKELPALIPVLWDILLNRAAAVTKNDIACVLLGKESYSATTGENAGAQEKISAMPVHIQMLCLAVRHCRDIELADYRGAYAKDRAEVLKRLYACLVPYGFSFAEENGAYTALMDGTSALYAGGETAGTKMNTEADGKSAESGKGNPLSKASANSTKTLPKAA